MGLVLPPCTQFTKLDTLSLYTLFHLDLFFAYLAVFTRSRVPSRFTYSGVKNTLNSLLMSAWALTGSLSIAWQAVSGSLANKVGTGPASSSSSHMSVVSGQVSTSVVGTLSLQGGKHINKIKAKKENF